MPFESLPDSLRFDSVRPRTHRVRKLVSIPARSILVERAEPLLTIRLSVLCLREGLDHIEPATRSDGLGIAPALAIGNGSEPG